MGWDEIRDKVKEELEEGEFDEDSDHPVHEDFTDEEDFLEGEEKED